MVLFLMYLLNIPGVVCNYLRSVIFLKISEIVAKKLQRNVPLKICMFHRGPESARILERQQALAR